MTPDRQASRTRRRRDRDFEVARALADPLRWRVVELLARRRRSVGELVEELGATQPLVSHHLRVLREAGVVEGERVRYRTIYRVRPEVLRALADRLERTADRAPGAPPVTA